MATFFDNYTVSVDDYLSNVRVKQYDNNLSISECTLLVLSEMEDEWNMFTQQNALNELSVLEDTGSEMVYEGVDIKGFFNKAKEFFKSLWSKIAGLFSNIITKIKQVVSNDKKFVESNKDNIINGYDKLENDVSVKAYDFANLRDDFIPFASIDNIYKWYLAGKKSPSACTVDMITMLENQYNENREKFRGSLLHVGKAVSDKEFGSIAEKKFLGSPITTMGAFKHEFKVSQIIDEVASGKDTQQRLKKMYNDIKKNINSAISETEKAAKKASDAYMPFYNLAIKSLKDANSAVTKMCSINVKCLNTKLSVFRSVCYKAAAEGKKDGKDKKKSTSESALFGDFGLQLI